MLDKNRIQIFFAVDDNFVKYTIVALTSLIENADKSKKYTLTVLNTGITQKYKDYAYALASDNFEIRFEDVTPYLQSISDKLPLRDYYSKTTYYRLFISEMYPELDKALYIDSDTVVLGDISQLFEIDLGDNYVGGAHEQAMVQVDAYGTYVEYCLGVSRYNYFNAGVILINCKAFRENCVLDRFIELLGVYPFKVTQDEDYLNVICEDKTLFVDQGWNMEVFGELCCKEEDFKILHYIMVSKPWHFEDCRLKEYFWKYAEKTPVYQEILDVLNSYTDEQRANDLASCDRLHQLAIDETNRADNYFNMMAINDKKSPERMRILEKIEKLEREGKFDVDVEDDPPSPELTPDNVDYLRRGITKKLKTKFAFMMARRFLKKILKHKQMIVKEIRGIENLRSVQSGAIITCNHFNPFDSFAIQMAYEEANVKKKFYRVIKEGNYLTFPGFYGFLMRHCNTLPLSSNYQTMKDFLSATAKLLSDGHLILVYPEQSLWWNYRKPKPLKKGAFSLASKNNVPVVPCFITMQDSDLKDEHGFFIQEYTIHILPPIYPSKDKSVKENTQEMLDKNYQMWKEVYEKEYNTPLTYLTDK